MNARRITLCIAAVLACVVWILFDDTPRHDIDVLVEPTTSVAHDAVLPVAVEANAPALLAPAHLEDSATKDGMPTFEVFRELRVYDNVTGVRLTHGTILTSPDEIGAEHMGHGPVPNKDFSTEATGHFPERIEYTGDDFFAWIRAEGYGWKPVILFDDAAPLDVWLTPSCAVVLALSDDPTPCQSTIGLVVANVWPVGAPQRAVQPPSSQESIAGWPKHDIDLGPIPHGTYVVELRRFSHIGSGSLLARHSFATEGASSLRVPVDLTARRAPPGTLVIHATELPERFREVGYRSAIHLQPDDDAANAMSYGAPEWVEGDGEWTVTFGCLEPGRYRVWNSVLPVQVVEVSAGGDTDVFFDYSRLAHIECTFEECASASPWVSWRFEEDPESHWRSWFSGEVDARPILIRVLGERVAAPMRVTLRPGVTTEVLITCTLGSLVADLTIHGVTSALSRPDLTAALDVTSDAGRFVSWIPLAPSDPPLMIQMGFSEPGRYDLTFTTPDGRRATFPIILGGDENPAIELHWTQP